MNSVQEGASSMKKKSEVGSGCGRKGLKVGSAGFHHEGEGFWKELSRCYLSCSEIPFIDWYI